MVLYILDIGKTDIKYQQKTSIICYLNVLKSKKDSLNSPFLMNVLHDEFPRFFLRWYDIILIGQHLDEIV